MREKIKLVSTAGTGHFYTTTKNKRLHPDKMEVRKFDPKARVGESEPHPAILALDPETTVLQVREEPPLGFVVRVGNVVPDDRLLAGYLTYARHDAAPECGKLRILLTNQPPLKSRGLITRGLITTIPVPRRTSPNPLQPRNGRAL